ncbi:MAG: 50S ribosomal protein L11 methyltransferase [Aquisalimonadaceae bacterium]
MKQYFHEQPWLPFSESLLEWDEAFHQLMLGDTLRMNAYRTAIQETVKPGDVVLDLGTGTGILSLWALEAGAHRVYGVDLDGDILKRAVSRIEQAGFADHFEPINKISYEVELPRKVDVLISEIMGNMGDNEDFQPIIQDAIHRFLKPDGVTLPLKVTSYLVPVSSPRAHQLIKEREIATLNDHYHLDTLCEEKALNGPFNLYYDTILPKAGYIGDPAVLNRFHRDWDQPPTYDINLSFNVKKPAVLTGFKVYFVAQLTASVTLDISGDDIDNRETSDSWKHAYLPIESPIKIEPGDQIRVQYSRAYPDTTVAFRQIYTWSGQIVREGKIVATFRQSMAARADAASL